MRVIATYVPGGTDVVADIGTDHALLPIELVRTGRALRCIATDLRPGPLSAAARTLTRAKLTERVELRIGDGLSPLAPGEARVVCISGLGGARIRSILDEGRSVLAEVDRLVLNPVGMERHVIDWLAENHWSLLAQHELTCGAFRYQVIAANRT